MLKFDNQIYTDFRAVILGCLQQEGLTDWDVLQIEQPTIQAAQNKTAYITKISSDRIGTAQRYARWDETEQKMFHVEQWLEEINMQISCFKKRQQDGQLAPEDEKTGIDVANILMTYFNGDAGRAAMRELGYQFFPIQHVRNPAFETDSNLLERWPNFDIRAILTQQKTTEIPYTGEVNVNIYQVPN